MTTPNAENTRQAARVAISDAYDALVAAYDGNRGAALAAFLYNIDADTRLRGINSIAIVPGSNDVTGPYDATVRLAGINYRVIKGEGNGRINVTRDVINMRDINGVIARTTTYSVEKDSVPNALKDLSMQAGRQACLLAEQALLVHEVKEKSERAAKPSKNAAIDAKLDRLESMMAAFVAAQLAGQTAAASDAPSEKATK